MHIQGPNSHKLLFRERMAGESGNVAWMSLSTSSASFAMELDIVIYRYDFGYAH